MQPNTLQNIFCVLKKGLKNICGPSIHPLIQHILIQLMLLPPDCFQAVFVYILSDEALKWRMSEMRLLKAFGYNDPV